LILTRHIAAVAAAALVAGVVAFLTSAMPPAMAGPQVEGAVHQPPAKSDRGSLLVTGFACSSQSWPNYDLNCQFDTRRPANEAPAVRRVIALR
jgi:hypothetical protein